MSHAAATAAKKNATLDQKVEASSKFLSPEAKRGWKINTPTLIHTHTQTHTVTMTGTTAAIKENTFTNLFACTLSFSVVPTLFLSLTLAPSAYNVTKAPVQKKNKFKLNLHSFKRGTFCFTFVHFLLHQYFGKTHVNYLSKFSIKNKIIKWK